MTTATPWRRRDRARARGVCCALGALLAVLAAAPAHADPVGSLTGVKTSGQRVSGLLTVTDNGGVAAIDAGSLTATIDSRSVPLTVDAGAPVERATMLVIDTSGSMGEAGMAVVRSSVAAFLASAPNDVKVGVASFASTAGVDLDPTTDRVRVQAVVDSLRSTGDTALNAGVQAAVTSLGTTGERSIVLLSDGGESIATDKAAALAQTVALLGQQHVRAEVVAFATAESDTAALAAMASAGGGSVAPAADGNAVQAAFANAAAILQKQVGWHLDAPADLAAGSPVPVLLSGTVGGKPFTITTAVTLTASSASASPSTSAGPAKSSAGGLATGGMRWGLIAAIATMAVGLFGLVMAFGAPAFTSVRQRRIADIDRYTRTGRAATAGAARVATSPSALGDQLVNLGDRVMAGRPSTSSTMALIERADLPWRAGEWFLLRILAVIISILVFVLILGADSRWLAILIGLVVGLILPAAILRFLARRRASRFEAVLPDILMLVATSLKSGFSLPQALDAVARDAPEPAAKEFSRALAETRIGADVADALDHTAVRMNSENMRWTTMSIRIQREVGGNLAETLQTTTQTLRERESLRRQVRALSAEGRLSAYVLIALPIGVFLYSLRVNYDYIRLLWTTLPGIVMSVGGLIAMVLGVIWMRKIVKIEV